MDRNAKETSDAIIGWELGQPWPGVDGIYAGVSTSKDGAVYALVLLNAKPPKRLIWRKGMEWAQGLGAELPNRPEGALLFANLPDQFEKTWHWLSEQYSEGTAWCQYFINGSQLANGKKFEAACRAVRRFPLQSFNPSVSAS